MTQTAAAADGTPIAFGDHGSGPPIVLVHGITENRRAWDPLIAPISELHDGHRVVSVDLRGHGESGSNAPYDLATMAGDVAAVVTHLGFDSPTLIGHSLGGTVVSAYASAMPVAAVVNIDQSLQLAAFQADLKAAAPMLRGEGFEAVLAQLFDTLAGPLDGPERERIDGLRQPRQDVVLGVWSAVIDSDLAELEALVEATMGGVTVPYLSLHGIDPGEGYADWLRSMVSNATVELWPDHGHYPHLVSPDRFIARLDEFLQ